MKKIIIRNNEKTDPKYGVFPEKRSVEEHIVNGIVNLDKPRGPTSHQVTHWVKLIFNLKKAGHGGTLDPAVTGVLPIVMQNATKLSKLFLKSKKEYVALMHMHSDVHEGKIRDAMESFVGKIKQTPPLRSNVKRVEREREIYYLDFLEKNGRDILFKVGCERGTYVRRLCEQLGKMAGTKAHMIELRRTRAGGFSEEERLVTLQDLNDAYSFYKEEGNDKFLRYCIQPMEIVANVLPKVWIIDSAVDPICNGAKLAAPGISKLEDKIEKGKEIAIMSLKGELVALGIAEMSAKGMAEAKEGIAASLERVIMKSGTYPVWEKKN